MTAPESAVATAATATLDRAGALALDAVDPLARFRQRFHLPRHSDGTEQVYLVGNSLGLAPRTAAERVNAELERWATLGVAGHVTGDLAWAPYHELATEPMARIVGGSAEEVVVMNSLTVNLHLLMVSFYRPDQQRHKILIEDHAFPSDHFAVESQIRQRGFDPATSLVTVSPRPGSDVLDEADIVAAIAEHGDELALILLPGVQYYTGQVLPMADITAAGHDAGAVVGFDLAHAAGNVPLQLHDWGVDFAAWCTYKYLNAGPGGIAGAFVNQRHVAEPGLAKFTGWWGTEKASRFEMATEFTPIPTVESWQLSNPPILMVAALLAALEIFDEAGGLDPLRAKTEQQIHYLDRLLDAVLGDRIEQVNPTALPQRGCQFALRVTDPAGDGAAGGRLEGSAGGRLEGAASGRKDGQQVHAALEAAGVACDWRYPDVIRVAPVPLYTSFADLHRFVEILDGLV